MSEAARQIRRAARRLGGRHQATADSVHIVDAAMEAGGLFRNGTYQGLIGMAVVGSTWLVGPAAMGIVGQSEVGSGDYASSIDVDTTARVGGSWVGRGLKRIG